MEEKNMCGRYFFDLSSRELKDYYDQVIPNALASKFELDTMKFSLQIML